MSFGMAGAAPGTPPQKVRGSPAMARQHLEDLSLILRGRSITRSISVSFGMAGAALGGSQSPVAWQVQHSEHLQRGLREFGDDWVLWAPAAFAWQVQHLEDLSLILRGRCSARRVGGSHVHAFPGSHVHANDSWQKVASTREVKTSIFTG